MEKNDLFGKIAINAMKSQSDILADKIKNMIVSQELKEGYQFPNENEFCRILNVGRGTLREAYKILDTQGYLRRTKHGTFVRRKEDVARDGNFQASLELADYDELAEFVCALEPEAVYLAAKRMTDEKLARIDELRAACEEHKKDARKLSEVNNLFNRAIWDACENQLIISSLNAYYDTFHQRILEPIYAAAARYEQFTENALQQHRDLVDALRAHDAERARKISYEHLQADLEYRKSIQAYN